ncbi:Guanylate-binding protein 6, partial [Camelus dromedarius]
ENIKNKEEDFLMQKKRQSIKYCQTKLIMLSKTLIKRIQQELLVLEVMNLYRKAKEIIEKEYHQVPRKGGEGKMSSSRGFWSQVGTRENILQADKALTEAGEGHSRRVDLEGDRRKEQELLIRKCRDSSTAEGVSGREFTETKRPDDEKLGERKRKNLLREPHKDIGASAEGESGCGQ